MCWEFCIPGKCVLGHLKIYQIICTRVKTQGYSKTKICAYVHLIVFASDLSNTAIIILSKAKKVLSYFAKRLFGTYFFCYLKTISIGHKVVQNIMQYNDANYYSTMTTYTKHYLVDINH